MRGPKPKATVVKLITGNPGRRPVNSQEARPEVVVPEPPSILKKDALAEWKRITPLLADVGLITKLDRAIVASYCVAWGRWVECEQKIRRQGMVVKSPSGYPIYSPYFTAANKALAQVRQLAEQIGLSASARSRIKAGEPAGGFDGGEDFLSRRGS